VRSRPTEHGRGREHGIAGHHGLGRRRARDRAGLVRRPGDGQRPRHVLFGDAEPGGRLPTTFPVRLEHNPSFGNFPGEFGELRYGEGVLLGYRWYEARQLPTRFPFGHGLSYSTYAFGAPTVTSAADGAGDAVTVRVEVTNTGARRGPKWCSATSRRRHRGSSRARRRS